MAEKDPHYFHAEANALTGRLTKPFEAQIKKQSFVKLEGKSRLVLIEGADNEKKAQENFRKHQNRSPQNRTFR